MTTSALAALVARLADRSAARTEAMIQADVRQLLLSAPLNLEDANLQDILLESPVGDRRRIDVELGATVIEVKKDLRRGNVVHDAVEQLLGYVATRQEQTGCRYVGLLTDGADWQCYHIQVGEMARVTTIGIRSQSPDVDSLLVWLEGVLATAKSIKPTAKEIQDRLGNSSSSHALDNASLTALYEPLREYRRLRWLTQAAIA